MARPPAGSSLWLHVIASFLAQSGFHLFTALIPYRMGQLGTGDAAIGVVLGLGAFIQVPAALGMGHLTRRVGIEGVLRIALVCYAAGALSILIAFASMSDVTPLAALGRSLSGIGFGLMAPATMTRAIRLARGDGVAAAIGGTASAMHIAFIVFPPLALFLFGLGDVALVAIFVPSMLALSAVLFRASREAVTQDPGSSAAVEPAPRTSALLVHVGMALHVALQGVLFTRIPAYASEATASTFFVAVGLGVVSGRILLSRQAHTPTTFWLGFATALNVVGLAILHLSPDPLGAASTGVLMGVGSGVMMQLLTQWFADTPREHHAVHLSRFSAAMAIGIGLGALVSASLPAGDPIRSPIAILMATAVLAMACAMIGKVRLERTNPAFGAT